MISYCKIIANDFVGQAARMLGWSVLFKVLGLLVLGPAAAWIVLQLIAFSGQSAISNVAIANFLMSPLGWFTLLIFVGLGWTVEYLGQAGLLLIQYGQIVDKPQPVRLAVLSTFRRAPTIIQLALIFVALFLVVASPFLALLWITYRLLLSDFDINYYLTKQPTEFWLALALGGILAVGLLFAWSFVYARTLFALPECVLRLQQPIASLKSSYQLTRSVAWTIFKWLIGWLIVNSVIFAAITGAVQFIEFLGLRVAGETLEVVALVVGLLLTLNLVVVALTSMFGNISLSLLIGRLYWSRLNNEPPMQAGTCDDHYRELPGIEMTGSGATPDSFLSTVSWTKARRTTMVLIAIALISSLGFSLFLLSNVKYEDRVLVPTLQEVIDASKGKIKLNIELKFNGHDKELARRSMDVVKQNGFESQSVVSSLDHESLKKVQSIAPDIKVGAIVGASIGDLSRLETDFIAVNVGQVDRVLVRSLHRQGKTIHVWTVNDIETMSDMIDLGVDNIMTDEPKKLIGLLREREHLTDAQRLLLAFRQLIEY